MSWSLPDVETLHAILGKAPGFIVYTDADLTIRYINRTSYGYSMEDTIGASYLSFLPPIQAEGIERTVAEALRTGTDQYVETCLDGAAGGRYWFSQRVSTLLDQNGEPAGIVSIAADITEQKLAQAELEKTRKELLEASHRAGMAEVATSVLHNIGNLLNSVNVSASLALEQLDASRLPLLGRALALVTEHRDDLAGFLQNDDKGKQLPGFLEKLALEITAEHERLRAELERQREHLDLMRATVEAQQALARAGALIDACPLGEIVDRVLSIVRIDIERFDIDLSLDIAPDTARLDRHAVMQVLANLIRNAIEALEPVDTGRRALALAARVDDGNAIFEVRDSGVGIAPDDLIRIFHFGYTTKPSGHGFGLHASAVAAQTMGGSLVADSPGPDQGATFRLSVPCLPAEPEA